MPLHRNATFLLGLFPIVLLLWAWADSVKRHTNWYHYLKDERTRCFIITNSKFQTELVTRKPDYDGPALRQTPFYGGMHRFGAPTTDKEGKPIPIFPPLDWHDEEATDRAPGYHVDTFVVPLWFILACYLPLWLAASHWHARRKQKRLASSLPPAQPQTDL